MSLFSKLGIGGTKEEREARSVAKLQKKVTEKYGPPENRQGAIEELGELARAGSEPAFDALLHRYTIRIDPGITDDDERARVHALIVQAGNKSLPALKRFLMGRDEVSWPIRAINELLPEGEVVKLLLEVLAKAAAEYSRVPEKKVLLLRALAAHQKAQGATAAALPFLDDMDDEVQIAAAQVLSAQADDEGREPLIKALLKADKDKNARVRETLAGLLADSPWDVKGHTPAVEAALPAAYKLDKSGKVLRK
jgi:HEAT repeat protein